VQEFTKGRYRIRLASDVRDLVAVQRLRFRAFRGGPRESTERDADAFDARCRHVMVEGGSGEVLATCRVLLAQRPEALALCYSAQFYDLASLSALNGPYLEIGRFCMDPPQGEAADALRLVWAALTRIVQAEGVAVMFGCTSFLGCDPSAHAEALSLLAAKHLGPAGLRPRAVAPERVPLPIASHDATRAAAQMPPLLRSYLLMGGWVGAEAVIDRDLSTLHVFTAVEVAAIPPTRARLLRADAS
jgi:putative hemolysin